MKKICYLILLFILFSFNAYAKDYVIGDGDTIQISVWGSPELSLQTTVRPDGKISIPALGEIKASGSTPMELTAILEKDLKKVIKTPIVTIIVTTMTNYRIFIFGKGAPVGVMTLTRETTLLELLSQLGTLENADLENSYLVRSKKKIKTGFVELFEKGDFSQDIILEPNDMLFIPDNFERRIRVVGAVINPTTMAYREGLTVMDVILSSGGFTEFAKENDVEIYRKPHKAAGAESSSSLVISAEGLAPGGKYANRKKLSVRAKDLMKGDLSKNIMIMPGDVIVVKESLF